MPKTIPKTANKPLISVIMPVYNAELYLRRALDSILRQTYTNFELIIVNDGSTDNSKTILDNYAIRDDRINVYHRKNFGVVAASNFAATHAKGEYIIRHDADDISFDTKLQDYIDTLNRQPDAIVVTGNIEVINERDEFLYADFVPTTDEDIKRSLHLRNPLPNGATLVRKKEFKAVNGYSDVFAEDCDLWVKLYTLGQFVGTGTFVYKWRTNSTGLTFTNQKRSIEKEKECVGRVWGIERSDFVPRDAIISHSQSLVDLSERYGISHKKAYLHDLARISVHFIKRGDVIHGFKQLVAVASTGRTGLRTVLSRISLTIRGNLFSKEQS